MMNMAPKMKLLKAFLAIALALSFLVSCSNAVDGDPVRLPPSGTVVILEASNSTQAYFNITLSEVPDGYDVKNSTYLGWCVDRSAEMTRSTPHTVNLYSSFGPEEGVESANWTKVNYILNHKQGSAQDVQEAIWYFINFNGTFSPESSVAMEIVEDAEANGTDFVPGVDEVAAVVAFPVYITDPTPVQISIFEITVSSSDSSSESPGNGGSPSIPEDEAFVAIAVIAIIIVVALVILFLYTRMRK
jgi:hypothetical protein